MREEEPADERRARVVVAHHADVPEEGLAAERQARVVALLEDVVATELRVTSGMFDLDLADEIVDNLTAGVTAGVLSAFAVDWSPDWTPGGAAHSWEEDGEYFTRCPVCLLDSPAMTTSDTAESWRHHHTATHDSAVAAGESSVGPPTGPSPRVRGPKRQRRFWAGRGRR